jgi:LEA14-like dessication related protein
MRKLVLASAVASLAVLANGCAGLKDLARAAFEPPKLTFRSASVQALDLEGATIAFLFDLANPNGVGAEVARASYAIEAAGTRLASGDLPSGVKIPANGTAPVSFPVRVRFRDVPGIVSLLTSGKDELPYALSGSLGVQTPIGILDVPLSHSDKLRLPKLPRISVEGLTVRSVSFDAVGVGVRLRVANPNAFPVPAGQLDYALALGGAQVASAQGAPLAGAPGGASAIVEIPVRVNLASAGRAAAALVQGGEVDVQLTGKAAVAGLPLPLDLHARVPARR